MGNIEEARRLVTSWWLAFGDRPVTVKEVIVRAMEPDGTCGLDIVLSAIAPSDYPNTYSAHRLGRWLARNLNEVFADPTDASIYRFARYGGPTTPVWQLRREEITTTVEDEADYITTDEEALDPPPHAAVA